MSGFHAPLGPFLAHEFTDNSALQTAVLKACIAKHATPNVCAAARSPLNDIDKCVRSEAIKNASKVLGASKNCCVKLGNVLAAELPALKVGLGALVAACG